MVWRCLQTDTSLAGPHCTSVFLSTLFLMQSSDALFGDCLPLGSCWFFQSIFPWCTLLPNLHLSKSCTYFQTLLRGYLHEASWESSPVIIDPLSSPNDFIPPVLYSQSFITAPEWTGFDFKCSFLSIGNGCLEHYIEKDSKGIPGFLKQGAKANWMHYVSVGEEREQTAHGFTNFI